jgi:alpha-tubulin suppressor-like RCC1 family protein
MICAGGSHSFAVSEHDEQLYAWGRNEHGELGRKDKSNQSLPTPLKGQGEPIDSITSAHSCISQW